MPNYVMLLRTQPGRVPGVAEEQEWDEWLGRISSSISDAGNRVGRSRSLSSDGTVPATVLGGSVVITAADLDAAAELAAGCPVLKYGGGVEVGEFVAQ
jgi:hypothetical protein